MRYLLLIVSLVVIGFTTVVSIPGSLYLIGWVTQADISAKYPTALTPAGFTFAIWSVIYLSWMIVGVYIAFFSREKKLSKNVLTSFTLAITLTAIWLIPWGLDMIWFSLIIMIALLWVLKYSYRISRKEEPLLRWSIDLTLGWIHIATVANVTIWLVSLGYTGGAHPEYWAIGVIWLAWLLTIYYQIRFRAYIISLVFLWAVAGIAYGQPQSLLHPVLAFYHLSIVALMVYTRWFSLRK